MNTAIEGFDSVGDLLLGPVKGTESRSRLTINQQWMGNQERYSIKIESMNVRPNLWRRFWYWALLGWTWEAL